MKAFISYSHRDAASLERLHKHMSMLRREGEIDDWYDREILAGGDIDNEIAAQLDTCELFLPLVSADFIASDYCYEKEMQRAIERHEAGEIRVVPIIVQPCDWQSSPLGRLKAVPKDGKPVSEWTNEDTAFLDVVTELRRIVNAVSPAVGQPVAEHESSKPAATTRYRVKKDFDQIDRGDFRDGCFVTIKEYFHGAIAELDSVEGIRGRFRDLGPTSFSCTVLNQMMNSEEAHITVHSSTGSHGMGDISYSYSENAPPSTANGWLTVDADEYDLFVRWHGMGYGDDQRVSSDSAAKLLWKDFLTHAGIDFG